MSLSDVSNAVYYYLSPENADIPNYGTLYQSLPKVANEQDLFVNTFPGLGLGCTIYMFPVSSSDCRIALGGQHGGEKWIEYTFALLIVMKSDAITTIEGQLAYNDLVSALMSWIRADRNAGTEAVTLGGFGPYAGTGIVFQMGEGGVNGGPDLRFTHYVPRTIDGGVTIFQSLCHLNVVEVLPT